MSLEIFPRNAPTVYPDDRQVFTARANDRTPMWANVPASGTSLSVVDPDYSIRYVRGLSASGEGALQLAGGVGSVEWRMNANGMPTGPSDIGLRWRFYFDGASTPKEHEYFVYILGATISIEDSGGVLATINHITAIGDVFKVELASGFRLYINGELKHSLTTFATAIKYPAQYDAFANDTVTEGPPRIPAPRLEGDWQLRPVVEFLDPAEGDLTTNGPALATEFFDGEVPGTYPLVARIGVGIDVWMEDAAPAGSSVSSTGGVWAFGNISPSQISGTQRLKSPLAAGDHEYRFFGATDTRQVNRGDILTCYVFLDVANPPTSIMLQWQATDGTGLDHRAYWGANSFTHGVDGQPSRKFMGALPPTGVWVRLEVPASLVDLEGRTLNGGIFSVFDGICSFDQFGKFPGLIQRAEALITIPTLKILGETTLTIEPEEVVSFQTNYDDAQTPNLVTWSKLSGDGSVTATGVFTAPAEPGTTVLRASGPGNQVADLTINIPAIITPNFGFVGPLEQVDFNTNIPPTVGWSSVPSGINSGTGVWTLPNEPGRKVRVSVTDGVFTAERDLLILPLFPLDNPSTPITADLNKTVLISESEDRSSYIARVKDKDGLSYLTQEVQFLNCELDELEAVIAFWEANFPGKQFILQDNSRPAKPRIVCRFDSALRWQLESSCAVNISFRVKEAAL